MEGFKIGIFKNAFQITQNGLQSKMLPIPISRDAKDAL